MLIDHATLEARVGAALEAYRHCELCSRLCGANRVEGRAGFCDLGQEAHVYKELLHWGEEAPLCPSHTIYLTGCSFRCAFCSDDRWVRDTALGRAVPPEALALRIRERLEQGARSLNFVGGSPDVNVLFILRTLAACLGNEALRPEQLHVVWNSNLYAGAALVTLLDGVVDTWLVDHKFGNDRCGRLAAAKDYGVVVPVALDRIAEGPAHLIIRHLLMPGHLECCTEPVLREAAQRWPQAAVNLMTAYVPYAAARHLPPLDRGPSAAEKERATRRAIEGVAGRRSERLLVNGTVVRWAGPWPSGWAKRASASQSTGEKIQ